MIWYVSRFWRFARGPNDGTEHEDEAGVWRRLFGTTWFLVTPRRDL